MKGFIGNRVRLVAYASAVGLFVFVALLAFPVVETSEDATAATGTALPSTTTLTLSSTNDNAFVNVVSNAAQGTFSASDANGTAGFSVTTNNFTGYTLSISSSDDAGKLENYTHDYIESISSNLTETDFSTASNTSYNNKWGFKPNKYVNNDTVVDNTGSNSVFLPSPTTTPTVLNITSAANTADDNYTIGLGLRADLLLPSGVYSKTLNLIALANVVSYTINFDKNTEDTTVTNMPTSASGTTSTTSITIPNTTPARANYTFEGWCDTISPTGQCDGTTYQPNGSFGIDQTTENVTTLYAIWMPTRTMQNVYSWMDDLSDGDSIEAHDVRDDKVYSIAKIDGVIWMATNLNLTGGTVLTSADSNVNTNYILPASSLSGFSDNTVAYVFNSSNTECAQDTPCYGYYSFAAASAGTSISQSGGSITYDICPKGWSLPTSEHFSSLVESYPSGGAITASIWKGVYSGRTIDGIFDHGGDMGGYWSSTIKDEYNAYFFSIEETLSKVNSGGSKSRGRAVRCVVKPTMQSVSVDYLEEHLPNAGDTMSLTDARDGKEYPITRIDDNNFWMTSNLDLAGGTVLTAADSNVVNNYTLPESEMSGFDSTTLPQVYNSDSTECGSSSPCYSYYNYVAATAGSNPSTGNSEVDICPKGWRLPQSTEYTGLIQYYYTHDVLEAAPWNGFESGIINHGNFSASRGLYWSSTAYDATHGRMLIFGPQYANAAVPSNDKYDGLGVRCIIKKPYMQDYSHSDLVSELPNTGDTRDLYDARDGKKYSVTNINGTIWMTTNLDLAGGTTLTAADSNVATSYTLPASSTSGFDDASVASVYNSGSTACGDNFPCYSYYNFAAATAGTNPGSGESIYDICPKGWRLPTKSDFAALILLYPTSNDLGSAPWNGLYGGFYSPSTFNRGGVSSDYWSSTAENGSRANRLYFGASQTENGSYGKAFGFSVRCVAKRYMQDMTSTDLLSLLPNTGDKMMLSDNRDGKSYGISNINGTIWMTTNLDLAGGTTLTPADSNVATDYTLPASNPSGFIEGTTANVYNSGSTTCSANSPCYSYYNFRAAVANTIPGPAEEALYDICPKGWRLPNYDDFSDLIDTVDTINEAPWYGVYAGDYYTGFNAGVDYNSSFLDGGKYGYIWGGYDTNTDPTAPNTMAGAMYFGKYGPDVAQESYVSGLSIRCVSK